MDTMDKDKTSLMGRGPHHDRHGLAPHLRTDSSGGGRRERQHDHDLREDLTSPRPRRFGTLRRCARPIRDSHRP